MVMAVIEWEAAVAAEVEHWYLSWLFACEQFAT
jgi:hypothetical protein